MRDAVGTGEPSTVQTAAWTDVLLERHGVVTRDGISSEPVPGGFTRFYPVLRRMEDIGSVRRGYFVEGMGGAQFALPGAVDRLRSPDDATVALASTDPASLYGAAVPWPKHEAGRPARAAGTWVIISDGALAAFLDTRRLLTFQEFDERIAGALAELGTRRNRMVINQIDGRSPATTTAGELLTRFGFAPTPRGLAYRGNRR